MYVTQLILFSCLKETTNTQPIIDACCNTLYSGIQCYVQIYHVFCMASLFKYLHSCIVQMYTVRESAQDLFYGV